MKADRAAARAAADPLADLCTFATVDAEGSPQVRTLVLRDLPNGLAVFVNNTSPKWRQLESQPRAQVLLYLPSLKVQYRIETKLSAIAKKLVDENWQLRPEIPKVMDWLYLKHYPQSSPLNSAERIAHAYRETRAVLTHPMSPAPSAQGLYLNPQRIERLELRHKDIHQRIRYTLLDGQWHCNHLIP